MKHIGNDCIQNALKHNLLIYICRVGCWAYNGVDVILKQHKPGGFDMSYFDPSSRYTIVRSAAKISTIEFEGEPYPALEIDFAVKARIDG
jgi:hypothetical protein